MKCEAEVKELLISNAIHLIAEGGFEKATTKTLMFKEHADVVAILHSVFTALFDFAIRVYNGELEDSEINRLHIFKVLYCMMTYFKNIEKVS